MRLSRRSRTSSITILTALTLFLSGCAMEFTPAGSTMFSPKKLSTADRAVEQARAAGKADQCPDAFQEAEKLRNEALRFYRACNEAEALARADSAISKANALCPPRAQAPPPPPPPPAPVIPPPPPTPTATISASPASVQRGACTTLSWSSTNATSAMIDPSLGSVGLSGSQQVCPPATTQYAIAATGAGGTARASTTVTVTAPPPPPAPAPKVIDRLTLHINFDTDKSAIRNADVPELQKALAFVQRYAGSKVSIEGHTDNVGSEKYNQGLSERRAAAVKSWLLAHGATGGARMQTVGYGESRPVADNKTPQGRFENRRVEILIVSE